MATKTPRIDTARLLKLVGACEDATEWADDKPAKKAWESCKRGDWLLWISARVGVDRKLVVLAACDCAEKALKFIPDGETRPRKAIETARAWTRGEATIAEVRKAAAAADAAYAAYAAAAAADAAYAAYAAYAAAAAADADDAGAADARTSMRKECADAVRSRIPWAIVSEAALEKLG